MKRGPKFEADVVAFLRTAGFPDAERRVMGGARDRGDVAGVRGWVLELKASKAEDWGYELTEAEKEARNAGVPRFALVKKRRNKPIAEAFAVVPLWLLAELMREDVPMKEALT